MGFQIRAQRWPQGRRKLVAERAEYFRLVGLGVSSHEACRAVGVSYRTGHRWRNGYSYPGADGRPVVVAPAWPVPPPRPAAPCVPGPGSTPTSRHLSADERIYLADRLREGVSQRAIAAQMRRSPATISREVRRNGDAPGWYRPHAAQVRALARRPRPKPGKIAVCPQLREVVQHGLDAKWSPQQISMSLRQAFADQPEMHVCHETIYQALYVQGRGELRRELTRALRTGRARRIPQRTGEQRRPRFLAPSVMISQRPAEAADRAVPGHWEGDLIIGRNSKSAIGTLVERATRYVMLVHLGRDRTAAAVRDGLIDAMKTLPSQLKRSLTWDQGSEMALHHQFTLAADLPVYFCDPHSPWQRGSNENTNGLLRQYFPKGTDLSIHDPEHLQAVARELNMRPRKTLDWDTPAQRLAKVLAQDSSPPCVATTP
jgi:IS30 family transposase